MALFESRRLLHSCIGNAQDIVHLYPPLDHSQILPREFGVKLPPCFCCSRKYWRTQTECNCRCIRGQTDKDVESSPLLGSNHDDLESSDVPVEPVPGDVAAKKSISIRGLNKVFPAPEGSNKEDKVVAVKNLNLDLYEGQICALLGHNGAGKTTTISMLTGLYPVTEGQATVYGKSVVGNMEGIRSLMGELNMVA